MARNRWPPAISSRHLAVEESQQQRGDMRAVDIGVGHDDDALIAQVVAADILRPCRSPAPAPGRRVPGSAAAFRPPALATFRILPRKRQDRLGRAVARLLGAAAGAVAFDQENLGARGRIARAIGQLAGQAQLARRGLARDFFFLPLLETVLGLLDDELQQLVGFGRTFRQPMVEMIAHHILDQASARRARTACPWSGPGIPARG